MYYLILCTDIYVEYISMFRVIYSVDEFSSSNKSSILLIISQFFNNIIHLNISGVNLLRFFVIISFSIEKILLKGSKLAGIAR